MAELRFVGSVIPRQFRRGATETVGVLVPDIGNPFWADVLRGVEDTLQVNNLALLVSSTRQDPARALRAIAAFERQQVDGLLAPPGFPAARLEPFKNRPLGVVTVDGRLSRSNIPSVSLDDEKGGYLVANHLLGIGHRSLVLVNGPHSVSWCRDRAKGVRRALEEAGLDARSLVEVPVDELTVEKGIGSAERILEEARNGTAIACANDLLALGVLIGLRHRGLDVPRDYALAGFDDVDFAGALLPALTSVRQPAREMGTAAAQLLLQRPGLRSRHAVFEPELVIRESTQLISDKKPQKDHRKRSSSRDAAARSTRPSGEPGSRPSMNRSHAFGPT